MGRVGLLENHHRQPRRFATDRDHRHFDIAAVEERFDDRIMVERVNLGHRPR